MTGFRKILVADEETISFDLQRLTPPPGGAGLKAQNLYEAADAVLKEYFRSGGGSVPAPGVYDRIMREIEKPLIEQILALAKGNQIKAAKILGLNRNTLRKKIRDLAIEVRKS